MQAQLLDVIGELNRKRPDAFVVDIRDGWGGAQPRYITVFDPQVPVLESKDRSNGEVYRLDTQIRAPAVVLINGGTRSGKEVIAYVEGNGVEPDVVVPFDVRYSAGRDSQIDEALRLVSKGPVRE